VKDKVEAGAGQMGKPLIEDGNEQKPEKRLDAMRQARQVRSQSAHPADVDLA
jgi:hypothetical protein